MKRAVVLSTMAALLLTGCGGSNEPAAEESQAPVSEVSIAPAQGGQGPALTASFVTPKSADVSTAPVSIEIRVQLADEDGVDPSAVVALTHAESGESIDGTFKLITGGANDGAYRSDVEIPQGAPAGSWDVVVGNVKDSKGNETTGDVLNIDSIKVASK